MVRKGERSVVVQGKLYSANEAAEIIGLSAGALRLQARLNQVQFVRRGDKVTGKYLFPAYEVERLRLAYNPEFPADSESQ